MSVKRSRTGSSSSYLELPLPNAAASVGLVKAMRTDAYAEASRPTFSTVASPQNAGECDRMKIGEFLERCYYCKKRIAPNSEVFMYSNLCAFCSAECRDFQISLDQSAEKRAANSKEEAVKG